MRPSIYYIGPWSKPTGYGQAGRDTLMALLHAGVRVRLPPPDKEDQPLDERYAPLTDCVGLPLEYTTHVIAHSPSHGMYVRLGRSASSDRRGVFDFPQSVRRIALTAWESDRMPSAWVELYAKSFDEVWVPSEWNRKACAAHELPVQVVPHPFDPSRWFATQPGQTGGCGVCHEQRELTHNPFGGIAICPQCHSDAGRTEGNAYVFYNIGTWDERKNVRGLLIAYLTEFRADNAVVLTICGKADHAMLAAMPEMLDIPVDELACVEVLGDTARLSDDEILGLHRDSDCYVTLSRAEGFGLGAFEACCMGNQVIAPEYGGSEEFLRVYGDCPGCLRHGHCPRHTLEANAALAYGEKPPRDWHRVPVFETPVIAPLIHESSHTVAGLQIRSKAKTTMGGLRSDQLWAEPDIMACRRAMRWCYENRPMRRVDHRAMWAERFSYEAVGQKMRTLLETA